ncbi:MULTISPECIES: aminoglycoside phosphotransferase family protein [Myxococcus]|uniref:aminoglycoside phosphotransferase family protein n=1 Tax=Myxococcus TaxID=32 RepID=UPI0011441BC9|nr:MULTISPECIES: aminoglycoside phosphotransferase family protein [Myxococcus]NOK06355.1 APH(6) family putative aminoglycoside O-phosphotransferase [Myxococcus xanthus]
MFERHLALWGLTPDGAPIITRGARLLPVLWQGMAAMLRVSTEPEEKLGGVLMSWWGGDVAARVLAQADDALLLERAQGGRSLAEIARCGRDDEATRIICDTLAALHAPRPKPLPELTPLFVLFRDLEPAAATHGGLLSQSARVAHSLLASPQEVGVLHGDMHHDNILDFGARGWLAIDPKGLLGERGFDYANLFCNPDVGAPTHQVATVPGRFAKRLEIVVERSGLSRRRILQWILAWTGLSAAWFIGDGESPAVVFRIAELAIAELNR